MSSDAVIVLGGHAARVAVGAALVRGGAAPVLALSSGCPDRAPDAGAASLLPFTPVPFTTEGEARAVAGLVREHGWRSVIVVTSGYHVRRARILFNRVVPAEVEFVAAPYPRGLLPGTLVKEAGKLAYAVTLGRPSSTGEASERGRR